MKRLLLTVLCLLSLPLQAAELTPVQKVEVVWTLSNAVTALTVGAPVLLSAIATGKTAELCGVLKGKYDPTAADQCAGGDWVRIIPYLKKD